MVFCWESHNMWNYPEIDFGNGNKNFLESSVFIFFAGIKYSSTTRLDIPAFSVNNRCQICLRKQNLAWWVSCLLQLHKRHIAKPKSLAQLSYFSLCVGGGGMQTYSPAGAFICITDLLAYQIEPTWMDVWMGILYSSPCLWSPPLTFVSITTLLWGIFLLKFYILYH